MKINKRQGDIWSITVSTLFQEQTPWSVWGTAANRAPPKFSCHLWPKLLVSQLSGFGTGSYHGDCKDTGARHDNLIWHPWLTNLQDKRTECRVTIVDVVVGPMK